MTLKRSIHGGAIVAALVATAGLATYANPNNSSDVSAVDGAEPQQKVAWRQDAHAAMDHARKSGKLVFFDVGASWCPMCKKMQETTYTDPTICNELNKNFICVELDKDDNADGTNLSQALFIMALPTVVIVDPQTDKYIMKVGYLSAVKFEAMLTKVQQHGLRNGTSGFRLTPKIYGNR